MKLNWGWSIAIFYTLFVIIMVSMVVVSAQNKVQLVQEQYYDKDLNYEAFRQKRQNGSLLAEQLKIHYDGATRQLELVFPENSKIESGDVTLFRPSNLYQDKKFVLRPDTKNRMIIPLPEAAQGLWKVKLDFIADGKAYYKEESIVL